MNTSRLRLRFTPLFKNNSKSDSMCCLEIVPEVSCVQNLDKIKWQQGDNTIEYTIPITYKVILKKQQSSKTSDDEAVQTYHSCVDLLKPSSITAMNVRSDDITKMISDTLIMRYQSDDMAVGAYEQTAKKKQTERKVSRRTVYSNTGSINSKNKYKREIKDKGTQFTEISDRSNTCHTKKIYLIDKITSTPFTSSTCHRDTSYIMSCNGALDCVSSFAGKVDRNLSITPICSFNTNDNILDPVKGRASNFIVLRIQDPKYNVAFTENCYRSAKFGVNDHNNYNHRFEVIKEINAKSVDTLTNKSSERVLPEVRVAQFMKAVEREILPMKNMLNDMIRKCTLLGFICKENQNPMVYNEMPIGTNKVSCCKKESKSNRVVYSIVFDG